MVAKSGQATVCFVIPTYNEVGNIIRLLEGLTELHTEDSTRFLVVDDSSPDGTGREVRKFARTDNRVRLLQGARRGLGDAYIRGMTHAMDRLEADIVVQMDADFSHDPADTVRLLETLRGGEPGTTDSKRKPDVVIGSRYVEGGSLDPGWGAKRRLLSRWGNRYAQWALRTEAVRDCTGGFKAIRAGALHAAKVGEMETRGYAFQTVLLHRLIKTGAKVVEIPIHFQDRKQGETKLGWRDMLEFARALARLR